MKTWRRSRRSVQPPYFGRTSAIQLAFAWGSAITPGGAWMMSAPTRLSAANASIRISDSFIEVRKCHSFSSAESTPPTRSAASGVGSVPPASSCVVALCAIRAPPSAAERRCERRETPEQVGDHEDAESYEHRPADERDGAVVAPDPAEPTGDPRRTHRHGEERHGEAGRVGEEEDSALGNALGRRGEADDPAQDRADAGAPAGREDDAEKERPAVAGDGEARPAPVPRPMTAPDPPPRATLRLAPPPKAAAPPPIAAPPKAGIGRVSRQSARRLITPATWRPRTIRTIPPTWRRYFALSARRSRSPRSRPRRPRRRG